MVELSRSVLTLIWGSFRASWRRRGTLHSTSNIVMNRVTTIGAGNATIETDAGTTLAQQGNIAGAGALTKTGDGALVLTGTGTYTGGTAIASGLLQLGDGGTSGSIVGDVANNGTLAFNRSDALVFDGVISGTGNVRQIGTGITVLNKQSAYTGMTSVEAGTLAAGGVNYFSSNSDFAVAQAGTLALNDFNQSLKSLNNSGIVDLGPEAGTTLTVTSDYIGNGGTVQIGTVLGNDSSVTDRLVVNGNTSGTGILAVRNVGGSGAQTNEGIKIVDIGGASNATFTLLGDYEFQDAPAVVGGAYAYQLYKMARPIRTMVTGICVRPSRTPSMAAEQMVAVMAARKCPLPAGCSWLRGLSAASAGAERLADVATACRQSLLEQCR